METSKTITFTPGELERLQVIVAANLDMSLVPTMTEAAKRGLTDKVIQCAKTIEKDKALLGKLMK